MISLLEFENFVHSKLVYEQNIISVIDEDGKQIYLNSLGDLYKYNACTIKIEQMEKYNQSIFNFCKELAIKYNHDGPVSCHAFRAFKDSVSFGLHTDPDDVIILGVAGIKWMNIDSKEHCIGPNQSVLIPANTPHEALNKEDSLMLSFGLEHFLKDKVISYELDVLSEDDRNVQP
jgi:mannose-6-phosphate isomerase-like protein (cupin superfamily)